MPTGLVIMHWDERVGVEVLGAYPEEVVIQEKTLMQLYSQHEFTGEAGMVSLTAGAVNLASYYTGPESAVYVILILTAEEDGDVYEEGLAEITRQILMNLESDSLNSILPPLFQRLSVYPTLTEEQRYGMLLNSDVKRMLLNRLREETAISKSEISIWMKDQYREGFVDVENLLAGMVKLGLVKIASVKGLSSDLVFLTEDIMVLRTPPVELVKDPVDHHLPASLKDSYIKEVRNFFELYVPSEADNLAIIDKVLLDPACYEVIKLMREAMVTRNDLEKLRKKGVDDVDRVLKAMWETKMIAVFQDDKNNEYFCLTSDFFIERFYPRYNIDNIRQQYRTRSQNPNALLKALDMMKDEYYAQAKLKKAVAKKKEEVAAD
ncbi:hypothetical protein NEF87_001533 [Candidatus Lokiarchaeum ossiferum]|uniref:Uncharacterized protein n=1 Tax=Candidatus Lokiarchaeum ossiferum TaxID=2951803 RepID=A0ABY6HP05_9ARCH|nr:hypothetical protein NEF87_001533 [Candidatus Lokiarchaeum sp. B-35]